MLLTEKQWYNFVAVAYLYERIKHQEEVVLENEISRNGQGGKSETSCTPKIFGSTMGVHRSILDHE
jgi:hypothetical protein